MKKKEIKKEIKKVKKDIKKDGIYEIEEGYMTIVNGIEKEYIGERKNAFRAALMDYRVAKSI